jgi:hypothetical protein
MPDAIGSEGECQRHAVLGIPVYAVRVDLLQTSAMASGQDFPGSRVP